MNDQLESLLRKCSELEEKLAESEKRRRESEDRFYKLFHASSYPIAISAIKDGRLMDLNQASAELGGYKREELIGAFEAERGLWADPEQRDTVVRKLQEEGKIHDYEVRLRSKNGLVRTALFSADPITLNDEPCLLSISTDITERAKIEAALKESEKKYRLLIENSLQGVAIMQQGRCVYCNGAFSRISGYTLEELRSLQLGKYAEMMHIEDLELFNQRYGDPSTGRPRLPHHYEGRLIRKDGSIRWLEVFAVSTEWEGKPAGQVVQFDITERKQAEEKLRKTLEWQRAIFEGSRDAILISDSDLLFVDANSAAVKLSGHSKEDLLKMRFSDLNKKTDHPQLEEIRHRILSGEEVTGELVLTTRDERKLDIEFSHQRVVIAGVPYIYTTMRDITARKQLESQFRQAQKMEAIGKLAGGVAHDFNNLLNVINGYCEMLLEDSESDNPKRNDIEQIGIAGKRAASLTSQLLAFSRKQILQPAILNLNDILQSMSTMLRRLIRESIDLAIVTHPALGLIYADPGQIQQIIMNLVVNARDAMLQGGKLTIETENVNIDEYYAQDHIAVTPGPYIILAISDTGIGMDANTQAHLFEPFFTTKQRGEGTGLGLSTVYGIVKQSNGFIWVYSEPGAGTTFKVYFPRVKGELPEPKEEKKSEPTAGGVETVLIAEDEQSVRTLTARILRERGYAVLEASNGIEALSIAQEYSGDIDLVLTDTVMPEMGGKELVSRITAVRSGIRVLYVSGYTDNAIAHHGILDSDIAFLQKPFSIESLARKVREVLDA
jgi:two-component system, cell cycle sensor histidine kinase and response regulator CckA